MIQKDQALGLFYKILRIRHVEEAIAKRYPDQEMRCPVHLSVGQEATPVGVCEALESNDVMVSTHRAHAHYLAKNGSLEALIGELYGRVTGCSRGQGGSMHLIDLQAHFLGATSIVGGTIPVGVGAAFAFKMKNEPRVSVVAIGDTAVEEGVFHESANFAALKKLPVLFMCENNGYSCYSPLKNRQPERPLTDVALAHGMFHQRIDGNDVFEVFEKTKTSLDRIRQGSGPAFIEYPTYRYLEHCGPFNDDNLNYRPNAEVEHWKTQDAIVRAREQLKNWHFWSEDAERAMMTKIENETQLAFENAIAAPYPEVHELGAYLYAE